MKRVMYLWSSLSIHLENERAVDDCIGLSAVHLYEKNILYDRQLSRMRASSVIKFK